MPKRGNKGEWSEFYAFLKILIEGKIFAADTADRKSETAFYPVSAIVRTESGVRKIYDISETGKIRISAGSDKESIVYVNDIRSAPGEILASIKAGDDVFGIPIAETLMNMLLCEKIKADSGRKADISVIIRGEEMGFSIKSELGSPGTLLNPSRSTNFVYGVEFAEGSNRHGDNANGPGKTVQAIESAGGIITFIGIDGDIFSENLTEIDDCLPEILAEFLLCRARGRENRINRLTRKVEERNSAKALCHIENAESKIKKVLVSAALGMTPTKRWDGSWQADGYMVIKENGEIFCYHARRNLAAFRDYLFENTRLDSPSTSRYDFGYVYEEAGQGRLKLNLQIRFI